MEIRTLESVGIQTVESGIKTAKQKITTTEERAEEALLNSTMGEEENDDSFDQDRRNKKGGNHKSWMDTIYRGRNRRKELERKREQIKKRATGKQKQK